MKIKKLTESKRSQGELITTVLLILIGIAAVVIVSGFVINMVRDNLKSTDCFKTTGQLKINVEEQYTWYDNTSDTVSISIERGENQFNLTEISVAIGNGAESHAYVIKPGAPGGITMYDDKQADIVLPNPSETETYHLNVAGIGISGINQAKIVPVIYPEQRCNEGTVESDIPAQSTT